MDHQWGKTRQLPLPGELFRQFQHDVPGNIQSAVVQRAAVALYTGVAVFRVEQEHVAGGDDVVCALAEERALSAFHQPDDVVLVKMMREGLCDTGEAAGLQMQSVIVDSGSCFLFHAPYLLAGIIVPRLRRRVLQNIFILGGKRISFNLCLTILHHTWYN